MRTLGERQKRTCTFGCNNEVGVVSVQGNLPQLKPLGLVLTPPSACRGDCCTERLTYFEIRVGNTSAASDPTANALCVSYDTPVQSVYTLTCTTPVTGRYMVVRLRPEYNAQRGNFLTLCEVNVFGLPPIPSPRQARGAVCFLLH